MTIEDVAADPSDLTFRSISLSRPVRRVLGQSRESQPRLVNDFPVWADEAEIIALAKQDTRAFAQLYDRHFDRIYRYIYRRTGDREVAEDLTSQTFQQALAALGGFEWRGLPFSAWLYRIASNLVSRHRQTSGREVAMEYVERIVDQRGSFEDPLESLIQRSSSDVLHEALERLNPDQQRAIVLKYAHGLKNAEVGALMNRSEGGIKQLVHRAMLVLRSVLAELEQRKSSADAERKIIHH
jgi:RNA polymerase sigma-70 factor, ECF subfamily